MTVAAIVLDPQEEALRRALKVKKLADVSFPALKYWNYSGCKHHEKPIETCEYEACGGEFYSHQRVGITWLYLVRRAICADVTGSGKTHHALGLAALLKERGELGGRMLVICKPAAVDQWRTEATRWVPGLKVITGTGTKADRVQKYASQWDICIVGYQMMLQDLEWLAKIAPANIISDDVEPLRNPDTKTWKGFNRLSRNADRVVVFNATPMHIKLEEWWATVTATCGPNIFGTKKDFERTYLRTERSFIYVKQRVKGRGRPKLTRVAKTNVTGYQNGESFKAKLAPIVIRRGYADLDVKMPDIAPVETIWLDLHPEQRKAYDELQTGVLSLIQAEGKKVKHAAAMTKVGYGQQICAGLPAMNLPDGPGASVKLDWVMDQLTHDWAEEKVVVYIKNVGLVKALVSRCEAQGIGTARFWGLEAKPGEREAQRKNFWRDPNCRVAVGTSAIESSLNLQVARILVNVDTLLNPQRMLQILGRVRRAGSKHDRVHAFTLLAKQTQEERYMAVLAQRAALASFVWDEAEEVYPQLSPLELLQLIRP